MENNLNAQAQKELIEKLLGAVNSAEEYYYLQAELQELNKEASEERASHLQSQGLEVVA